jgi:hypothetical protein
MMHGSMNIMLGSGIHWTKTIFIIDMGKRKKVLREFHSHNQKEKAVPKIHIYVKKLFLI